MRTSRIQRATAGAVLAMGACLVLPSAVRASVAAPVQNGKPAQNEDAKAKERAERIAKERAEKERAEKERAEKAKPKEGAKPEAPTKKSVHRAVSPEEREIAKKAAHFERAHRTRQARIDRLIAIYKAKGDTAKVAKLEELRAKDDKRTANAMEGFRKKLGEENWGRVNSQLKKHHGRDEHQKEKTKGRGA